MLYLEPPFTQNSDKLNHINTCNIVFKLTKPEMQQTVGPVGPSSGWNGRSPGISKWAGTRYFYPSEIVYSTGRNYWTPPQLAVVKTTSTIDLWNIFHKKLMITSIAEFSHSNRTTASQPSWWDIPSSNNKTLNARLLARVITGCHYT